MKNKYDEFGKNVSKAAELLAKIFKKKDIPIFLQTPHVMLGAKTPLQALWEEGSTALKIIEIIVNHTLYGIVS